MATAEQLAEALRHLAEQEGQLQGFLGQFAQTSSTMISEMAKPKEKVWSDGVFYKNIRMFSGDFKE